VIIVVGGVGAYFATRTVGPNNSITTSNSTSTSLTTSNSQTGSGTQSTTSTTNSGSSSSNQNLVVEEGQQPDSMDPAVEFSTPGNEITSNIYQGLVAPDPTGTAYVGQLAESWTTSADGLNWNFSLRSGVKFSNGDPFNAFVMWYSLYRTIIMNQPPSFILSQNFGTNSTGINVTAALLNSFNYASPTTSEITMMETPLQSFQVINQSEIELNLGGGYNGNVSYSALLATLTAPCSFAVDPNVISAHGGVVANQRNSWMEDNAVGTGFYLLSPSWGGPDSTSITLAKNANYWADNLSSSQLDYAIQPAIINNVIIYYKPVSSTIADLKSGAAQIIGATDVSEISSISAVQGIPNVHVSILPIQFGSAVGVYFFFMNPYIDPQFNNVLVREAVTYAVDYAGIIHAVFGGYGQTWIGPIPPGFPDYNQTVAGLTGYSYNATKAAELLASAGYQATLPDGTKINPGGKVFPTLSFLYSQDISSEAAAAPIIANELSSIGMPVTLSSLSFAQYVTYLAGTGTGSYGFGIGDYSEDYFASQDFVTALASINYTGAPVLLSNESTFAVTAAGTTSNSVLLQAYRNVTTTMLSNYVLGWLYVGEQVAVNYNNVVGMIAPNPTGSCAGYFMYYNTVHYS
jgi:peptide/nickel transport system substrate-binding protein